MTFQRFAALALVLAESTLATPCWAGSDGQARLELPVSIATSSALPKGLRRNESARLQHQQLQLHQGLALSTLAAMAATTGLGYYAHEFAPTDQTRAWDAIHMGMGGLTTGLYLGAALLAITAPHGYDTEDEGPFDSVAIHRDLAAFHAAALISTLAMGVVTYMNSLEPGVHGQLGLATLGLMTVSAGVIALDF